MARLILIELTLVLLLGSSVAKCSGSIIYPMLLLNALLASFSVDFASANPTLLARNDRRFRRASDWYNLELTEKPQSTERPPPLDNNPKRSNFRLQPFDLQKEIRHSLRDTLNAEQLDKVIDQLEPLFLARIPRRRQADNPGDQLGNQFARVSGARRSRDSDPRSDDEIAYDEYQNLPNDYYHEGLYVVNRLISAAGERLGLGPHAIQDIFTGSDNAPSFQDILNSIMDLLGNPANIDVVDQLNYALDAFRQYLGSTSGDEYPGVAITTEHQEYNLARQ
ncbi:hypothetical protein KR222_010773 [Zaprionus bogoriensis]|nr:hypothetical protein KR222_010773 [Zaprionus bogoriensis]